MSDDNAHAFFLTRDAANRASDKRAKYHAVRRLFDDGRLATACGGLLVDPSSPLEAADVPDGRRCRAQGCRQRYAEAGVL